MKVIKKVETDINFRVRIIDQLIADPAKCDNLYNVLAFYKLPLITYFEVKREDKKNENKKKLRN